MTKHYIIVLTKSIPAKKFGIQTGESIFSAHVKCPDLVIVPPNYQLFMQCSSALGHVLRQYSSVVEQYSIDEYFLDYTHSIGLFGDPVKAAHLIKDRIRSELGFTVNIGVSSNKLLAKMAGELKKTDMVHTLFPDESPAKMWPLPIEELFMIGSATAKKFKSRLIYTIGDLANSDPKDIKLFLKSPGMLVWNYANGYDLSPVRENLRIVIKGIGNSSTIAFDIDDRETAHLALLSLTETVGARLRQAEYCAQVISVSLRTNEFYSCSHQKKYTPQQTVRIQFMRRCVSYSTNCGKGNRFGI